MLSFNNFILKVLDLALAAPFVLFRWLNKITVSGRGDHLRRIVQSVFTRRVVCRYDRVLCNVSTKEDRRDLHLGCQVEIRHQYGCTEVRTSV